MLDIYLKPEEMDKIINMATKLTNPMPLLEVMRFGDAVANASANNVVRVLIKWGDEHCPHAGPPGDDLIQQRKYCNACWNELKKLTETE